MRAERGSGPGQGTELRGHRLDRKLHQELQLVRRQEACHPLDDCCTSGVRLRPVGGTDGVEEGLDVLPLPIELLRSHGPAVPGLERGVRGQLLPQALEAAEPLVVEAVRQVGVLVAVSLVAEEDGPAVVAEEPGAVVG
jgi:hypothetical protein